MAQGSRHKEQEQELNSKINFVQATIEYKTPPLLGGANLRLLIL